VPASQINAERPPGGLAKKGDPLANVCALLAEAHRLPRVGVGKDEPRVRAEFSRWLDTVGEVEEAFARACYECDQRMGEPGGVLYFLRWFDETPRDHMREELTKEVKAILQERYNLCHQFWSEEIM
jgi:hypothetical protein